MAIGFARLEFVQRSAGKNACAKSAYIGRDKIRFNGKEFSEAKTYDWSRKSEIPYSEVLIPKHANKDFLNPEILWNAAESKENRKNSQTAMEAVIALPDDLEVSLEDKIEMLKGFVQTNFIDKGLAAQLVVHPPEAKIELDPVSGEIQNLDHNWHAHVLLTTRRFKENGEELEDKKARDLMPVIRNDKVISGPNWGNLWREYQNQYFESKGMSLRVDSKGIVSQIHLGPVRMRGKAFALLEKNEERKQENIEAIKDPERIVEKLTEKKNIFSLDDVKELVSKIPNIEIKEAVKIVEGVIAKSNVVQLLDPKTGKLPIDPKTDRPIEKYTTLEILIEEKKCFALASKIQKKTAFNVNTTENLKQFSSHLTDEQKAAFSNILNGSRLSCIEGHAGTGKSHLLVSLKKAYESEGFTVRAFGPDSSTSEVLKEKGFSSADNIYSFLFHAHNLENNGNNYWRATQLKRGRPYFSKSSKPGKTSKENLQIKKGKEIWMIDEATKLSNKPMLEILKLAEKYNAQVIFSGGASQLLPIERGCFFDAIMKRYGSEKLENIQRQKDVHQREIAKKIAKGEMADAIHQLVASKSIIFIDSRQKQNINPIPQGFIESTFGDESLERKLKDKEMAIEEIVKQWAADREAFPSASSIIIASSNNAVMTLNEMVRLYRKEKGEISNKDFRCETQSGEIYVSEGDHIEFSSNNKELGVNNGMKGVLIKASEDQFTVLIDDKKGKRREVKFNPSKYASFKLGYATTYFRSQGRTVDRAYILHSAYTNKEMFYVAMTRHVKKAYLFVPKSSLNYYTFLKAQAAGYVKDYKEHYKNNEYFVHKSTQQYIDNLIEQTSEPTPKLVTTDFTSKDQLNKLEREQHFADLKSSSSLFNRLKGHTLGIWDQAATKIDDFRQNKEQKKREADFYSPLIQPLPEKIRVRESIYEPSAQEYRQAFVRSLIENSPIDTNVPKGWESLLPEQQGLVRNYLEKANESWSLCKKVDQESQKDPEKRKSADHYSDWQKTSKERNASAYQIIDKIPVEVINQLFGEKCTQAIERQASHYEKFEKYLTVEEEKSLSTSSNHSKPQKEEKLTLKATSKNFSPEQEKLLNNYRKCSNESSSLYDLVQADSQGNQAKSSYHLSWQIACGKRNASAYELVKGVSKDNLSLALGSKSAEFVYDQAQRHEQLINRKQNSPIDIDAKLKENLEPLLCRLFPEGPTSKERGRLRFGSKGSLVVTCHGDKIGSFYSFEEGKGGGPLNLIQQTLGLDASTAKEWAMNFLGESKDITVPAQFKVKNRQMGPESQWISMKPGAENPAPSLNKIQNSKIHFYCREEARYAYRDEKGELLFYTVRLVDKEGKKKVYPLSYGFDKNKGDMPQWGFKAYQKSEKSLYNLQLLSQNPSAKVVIVEGEKTADAGNKLLNKHGMICLTWSGGAKATDKSDWSPLFGRDVIIWPDNDRAGFEASDSLCSELRKTGVKSLRVVDHDALTRIFPPKWDLADSIPEGKKESIIRDLLMSASEKSVELSHLSYAADKSNKSIELLKIREILWRVEERLRPELEKKYKNTPQEIRSQLIKETVSIYKQKNELSKNLEQQFKIDGHQAERLAFQSLVYHAQYGKQPSVENIIEMKTLLEKSATILPRCQSEDQLTKDIHIVSADKAIMSNFRGQSMGKGGPNDMTAIYEKEFAKTNQHIQQQMALQQIARQHSTSKGMDLSL